jgi:hypothetical protein
MKIKYVGPFSELRVNDTYDVVRGVPFFVADPEAKVLLQDPANFQEVVEPVEEVPEAPSLPKKGK